MKNKINNISRMRMLLGLTAIAALCVAPPVRAGTGPGSGHSSNSGKPSHGGGSGGGTPGGSFYATVSNVTQLIGDINYANAVGGTYTIYLQPNTTFSTSLEVGGTKAVNLTIIGNGDTIDGHQSRLFVVDRGSSLTLDQVTLQNGYVYAGYGGAIYNSGMLTISNCILSGNTSVDRSDYLSALRGVGGAIYNNGGKMVIAGSILSDNLSTGANPYGGAIYNYGGTVTISNSTFTNNDAAGNGGYTDPEYPESGEGGAIFNESGTVTVSHSILTGNYALLSGGGICNGFGYYSGGTVIVENSSKISGNTASVGADVDNGGALYLDGTSIIDVFVGYPAIPF